ncbi:hypothetical protein SUGI_0061230 [Cryptomeria japonica]|nr:hypothetical protein SUGI_0061230 [Cryptomeria japonica]
MNGVITIVQLSIQSSAFPFLSFSASLGGDHHIVEIPVDEEQKKIDSSSSPQHPLEEIADSRGHLLLLKLWQREEEIVAHHIDSKESRIDTISSDVFQLSCFFFAFHGIFLTLLFTAAIQENAHSCTRWWIPAILSFATSLVLIFTILHKLIVKGNVVKMLQKDKTDLRALARCIQELRMKGVSFDLSKEPQPAKRPRPMVMQVNFLQLANCERAEVKCLVCFLE